MEIGALMAPRPLLLVSATGDWTRETPRVEYPAVRSIYRLYGVEERLGSEQFDYGHNYNQDSREAVYRFMGKWLLGDPERWGDFAEPDFSVEDDGKLRVFPEGEGPQGYPTSDEIISETIQVSRDKWDGVLPKSHDELELLGLNFNQMVSSLDTSNKELLGSYDCGGPMELDII